MYPTMDFKTKIRFIPNWPKEGITTYDIGPLLADASGFRELIEQMAAPYLGKQVDAVVGIEARGFVLAAALAERLGTGVTLVRKKGKLPPPTVSQEYSFEYASHVIELPAQAFHAGQQVVVVDDILATGGTMAAAVKLVKQFPVEIIGISCAIEMVSMAGRDRLKGQTVHAVIPIA